MELDDKVKEFVSSEVTNATKKFEARNKELEKQIELSAQEFLKITDSIKIEHHKVAQTLEKTIGEDNAILEKRVEIVERKIEILKKIFREATELTVEEVRELHRIMKKDLKTAFDQFEKNITEKLDEHK